MTSKIINFTPILSNTAMTGDNFKLGYATVVDDYVHFNIEVYTSFGTWTSTAAMRWDLPFPISGAQPGTVVGIIAVTNSGGAVTNGTMFPLHYDGAGRIFANKPNGTQLQDADFGTINPQYFIQGSYRMLNS